MKRAAVASFLVLSAMTICGRASAGDPVGAVTSAGGDLLGGLGEPSFNTLELLPPRLGLPSLSVGARDAADEQSPKAKDADEQSPKAKDKEGSASSSDAEPWVENENETYKFVGLRGRYVVIPKFMFSLYQADGGTTVSSPGIGLEYAVRRNGFEYDGWLMYASYGMKDSPFKAKSDPDQAYEIVRSELKTLTIGADFLWSTPIDSGFSFVYGGGAGLGVVFGNLYRNQAYPPNGVAGDPNTYVKCPGPGINAWCGNDNDHYGNYTEPNWLDGGSKPIVFPWIALPQVGLRWKPSAQFAMRLDTGLSFPGPFFFGLSGQYGLQ